MLGLDCFDAPGQPHFVAHLSILAIHLIVSPDISLEWIMRQPVLDSWADQMRLLKGTAETNRPASTATSAG